MNAERRERHTVKIHDEGLDGLWAEVEELPGGGAGQDLGELYDALARPSDGWMTSRVAPVECV